MAFVCCWLAVHVGIVAIGVRVLLLGHTTNKQKSEKGIFGCEISTSNFVYSLFMTSAWRFICFIRGNNAIELDYVGCVCCNQNWSGGTCRVIVIIIDMDMRYYSSVSCGFLTCQSYTLPLWPILLLLLLLPQSFERDVRLMLCYIVRKCVNMRTLQIHTAHTSFTLQESTSNTECHIIIHCSPLNILIW